MRETRPGQALRAWPKGQAWWGGTLDWMVDEKILGVWSHFGVFYLYFSEGNKTLWAKHMGSHQRPAWFHLIFLTKWSIMQWHFEPLGSPLRLCGCLQYWSFRSWTINEPCHLSDTIGVYHHLQENLLACLLSLSEHEIIINSILLFWITIIFCTCTIPVTDKQLSSPNDDYSGTQTHFSKSSKLYFLGLYQCLGSWKSHCL